MVRLSAIRTGCLYPPGNIPGTHFCEILSQPQDHSAAGRIMSMKNSNDTIGNHTRDLPARSAVPQPIAPPRAPSLSYTPSIFHSSFLQMPWTKATLSVCYDNIHVTRSALKHLAHKPLSKAAHNCKCEIHTMSLPLYKCICQNHYRHREQCNLLFGCRIKLN